MTSFSSALLQWFHTNGRSLPWRADKNPYAIWLSEVILQQTRIAQGTAYWHRFMEQYPTVEALAEACEDDVLKLWQGLGYYSRARNLLVAAKQVVKLGGFPQSVKVLKQLKGVGDYTAAAIASIAFDVPAAVVDGNVYRVLARYFGIDTPINTTEGKKVFASLADELLPPKQASAYNQAIMDFGAIQCTPLAPRCDTCPLQSSCAAYRDKNVASLPVKLKNIKVVTRKMTYIYVQHEGKTAIRRRGKGDIWQGLWDFVTPEALGFQQLDEDFLNSHDIYLLAQDVKHVLTHRIILADFYLWKTACRPTLTSDYIWIEEETLHQYALPRLMQILYDRLPKPGELMLL